METSPQKCVPFFCKPGRAEIVCLESKVQMFISRFLPTVQDHFPEALKERPTTDTDGFLQLPLGSSSLLSASWPRLLLKTSPGWKRGGWPGWPCPGCRAITGISQTTASNTWSASARGNLPTTRPFQSCSFTTLRSSTSLLHRRPRSIDFCPSWRRPTPRRR